MWTLGRTTGDEDCYSSASLAALTGRALMTLRAGFALKMVGSFVNGLMPFRAFVAAFLMTTNFTKPGTDKRARSLELLVPKRCERLHDCLDIPLADAVRGTFPRASQSALTSTSVCPLVAPFRRKGR